MKKTLSILLAAALSLMSASAVFAEKELSPSIRVDGREIYFRDDQPPVIQNERLYVPVRRVIEEMGASVLWDDAEKTVTVSSPDNITRIILTIDNPEITVYTFTSVFHADKEIIENDVAPVIINERTMLPIRVIAEELGGTVLWDDAKKLTTITSKPAKNIAKVNGAEDFDSEDFNYAEFFKGKVPGLSIACDDTDIKEGDTVTVKLLLDNIETFAEDARLTSVTLGLNYDMDAFSYDGYQCHANGEDIADQLGTANGNFYEDCVKLITLNLPDNAYLPGEDKVVMHITFTALKDGGAEFSLSDAKTEIGYNTELLLVTGEEDINTVSDTNELYIDTTPIVVE